MKRDLLRALGLLALAFAAQPATAADLPVKAPVMRAPAAVPIAYSWTGCYIGAHVGGLWGKTRHDITPTVAAYVLDVDYSSVTAGGHVGCNYQVQQFVFGIEGDLSWADVDDQAQIVPFDQFYRTAFDWYATIRGRAGFAFDRWHIYGTGGFAFADIKMNWGGQPGNFLYSSTSKHGWVAGGGVEYAFASNWIGRIEYLYHRFEEGSFVSDGGDFRFDMRPSFHVVRAGLSYKFGAAPVMARY
jgi:outer membrane immunogenic protein